MRKQNSIVTNTHINTNSKQNHKHRHKQLQIGYPKQNNIDDMKQRVASLKSIPDIAKKNRVIKTLCFAGDLTLI